ncbi:MAG TPA: TetR/AcrR family transcriptional regulator [Woeseiaceae bacterium]|nr:TetR/AcrR family transcriptional regulator [Woeseiaceae bacterium]
MPRPPSFDRAEVIERATEAFWQRGYGATSVSDLVRATGLKPGSLYAAFGSKKGVFLEVLQSYQADSAERLEDSLREADSPLEAIRRFFLRLVDETLEDSGHRGCLMVNAMLEYSRHDADVQGELATGLRRIETLFGRALRRASEQGELDPRLDTDATAAFLVNNLWGIRVMCRGGPSREAVEGVVRTVLAALAASADQRGSMRRM